MKKSISINIYILFLLFYTFHIYHTDIKNKSNERIDLNHEYKTKINGNSTDM